MYTLTTSLLVRRCCTIVAWPVRVIFVWLFSWRYLPTIPTAFRRLVSVKNLLNIDILSVMTITTVFFWKFYKIQFFQRCLKGVREITVTMQSWKQSCSSAKRWKSRSGCVCDGTELEVALPFYQKCKDCSEDASQNIDSKRLLKHQQTVSNMDSRYILYLWYNYINLIHGGT